MTDNEKRPRVVLGWDGRVGTDGLTSQVAVNAGFVGLLTRRAEVTWIARPLDDRGHHSSPLASVYFPGDWVGVPSPRRIVRLARMVATRCRAADAAIVIGPGVLPTIVAFTFLFRGKRKRCLYWANTHPSAAMRAGNHAQGVTGLIAAIGGWACHFLTATSSGRVLRVSPKIPMPCRSQIAPEIDYRTIDAALEFSATRRPGVVLYAGRLEAEKGADHVIPAFARSSAAELRVAGDGSLRSLLQDQMDGCGARTVIMLGEIGRDEILVEMQRAAVVIVPSRVEGFGLSAFEAASLGAVVLVARVGGLPYALREFDNVVWWDGANEESLGRAIDGALGCARHGAVPSPREVARRSRWLTPEDVVDAVLSGPGR
jgi:glycosyltransferase involved in cell wall biosynthesis